MTLDSIRNSCDVSLNSPTSIHTCTHKCVHSLLETLHSSMVLKTVTQPVSTRMQISAEICLLFFSPHLYCSFLINLSLLATVFPLKSHQWTVTPQVSTSKHKEETVCSQCDLHSPVFLLWNYAWQLLKVVLETWFSSMVTLPASSKLTDATVCSNVAAASRSADLGRPTLQLGIRHLLLSSHSGNTLVSWFRRLVSAS